MTASEELRTQRDMSAKGPTKKALLIEDDAFTRYTMQQIAKSLGYELIVAENGANGLAIVRKNPSEYGVVLMDLHLPGQSGIEATKVIRSLPEGMGRDMPVIAVTADINYFDDAVVSQFGMNGFASKPVSPGRLMALLQRYCEAA
jgi:CheY-like chemotaxis protein